MTGFDDFGAHGDGDSRAVATGNGFADGAKSSVHPFLSPDEYGLGIGGMAAAPQYEGMMPLHVESPSAFDPPYGVSKDLQPYRVWDHFEEDPGKPSQARRSETATERRSSEAARAPETHAPQWLQKDRDRTGRSETTLNVRLDADYGSFLESPDPETQLKEWRERVAQHLGLPVSAVKLRRVQGP